MSGPLSIWTMLVKGYSLSGNSNNNGNGMRPRMSLCNPLSDLHGEEWYTMSTMGAMRLPNGQHGFGLHMRSTVNTIPGGTAVGSVHRQYHTRWHSGWVGSPSIPYPVAQRLGQLSLSRASPGCMN